MSRTIVVSLLCQTGGITAALRELLPADEFVPLGLSGDGAGGEGQELERALAGADLLLWTADQPVPPASEEVRKAQGVELVPIAPLLFGAFHPDLDTVVDLDTGQPIPPLYGSAIAAWAYNRGLDREATARLFRPEVFRELGYFHQWERWVGHLQGQVEGCGLDFRSFFLAVKRTGVFMHTANHPTAATLVTYAKAIAVRLGADRGIWAEELTIPDGLLHTVWPLYPALGEHYALSGSWRWRLAGRSVASLADYLDLTFSTYAQRGLAPGRLGLRWLDPAPYDRVLGPLAEES